MDPERLYAYMDILIGRDMGKNPELTRGRLIFELFDDIMPVSTSFREAARVHLSHRVCPPWQRTTDQFIRMLSNSQEPTYRGSTISQIFPVACPSDARALDRMVRLQPCHAFPRRAGSA